MLSKDNALFERAFDVLNQVYFDAKLPKVVITIQSKPKAYGYITCNEVWTDADRSYYEINITAEYLNRPMENVLATLQHEMVHLYCIINGIQDTSKKGRYHNKNFKAEAEKRGLLIEYVKYIGYSKTAPSEQFITVLQQHGLLEDTIQHFRLQPLDVSLPTTTTGKPKKKSSTRKYVCPACGMSVRATRVVHIICGDCFCVMEQEET